MDSSVGESSLDVLVVDLDPDRALLPSLSRILEPLGRVETVRWEDCGPEIPVPDVLRNTWAGAGVVVFPGGREAALETVIREIREKAPALPLLVATEIEQPKHLMRLIELGISDYVVPPLRAADVLPRLWRMAEPPPSRVASLKERVALRRLVGRSPAFVAVLDQLPLLARCDATVLIDGETGTGKEVCARAVHYLGRRADKPFVAVNCGALPEELVENELFGHERSAYTSAVSARRGLVDAAEGGTLLLDEIDSLSPNVQVKLLRFLQDKQYRALGSTRLRTADVRLIAATNADLAAAVAAGRFRQDLYYRLNTLPLTLPPLRERREDVLPLARHFLTRHAHEHDRKAPTLSPDSAQALLAHDWPGNVRELEHVIERAVLIADGGRVIRRAGLGLPGGATAVTFREAKRRVVARFERTYVENLLEANNGNISRAARAARKNRRAFWELIRKHRIDADRFRDRASRSSAV